MDNRSVAEPRKTQNDFRRAKRLARRLGVDLCKETPDFGGLPYLEPMAKLTIGRSTVYVRLSVAFDFLETYWPFVQNANARTDGDIEDLDEADFATMELLARLLTDEHERLRVVRVKFEAVQPTGILQ